LKLHGYIPSSVFYKGKCVECEDVKPLDEMVRKLGKKGLYWCIDCQVAHEVGLHDFEDIRLMYMWWLPVKDVSKVSDPLVVSNVTSLSRLRKLVGWCFG